MKNIRFPGTNIFRYHNDAYMVNNHYISAIAPFTKTTVCSIRNIPVQKHYYPYNKNNRENTLDESLFSLKNIQVESINPLPFDFEKKWTQFSLDETIQKFSTVPLKLYRQNIYCNDLNNIFNKTEVCVSGKSLYNIPVFCANSIKYQMERTVGATIYKDGDEIPVMSPQTLPIMSVSTSSNYSSDYLCDKDSSSGVYLERHCTPHIHRPENELSGGAIILARECLLEDVNSDEYSFELFAVKIPPKHTLLIPPFTWHNDCFLSGNYQVGYAVASSFETLVLLTRSGFVKG